MALRQWLVSGAVALQAAAAGAQTEPPATWDPRATSTAAVGGAGPPPVLAAPLAPGAAPALDPPVGEGPAPAAQPLDDVPPPPYRPPPRRNVDQRWSLSFEFGPAASGAPNGLLGVGLALGAIAGVRVETNVLVGFSASSEGVAADPAWNASNRTYTGADWSARTVLFELSASRRQGPAELWVGSGVHLSWAQWEAPYSYLQCTDLLCLGPKITGSDTEITAGSAGVGLLVGAGVRVAVYDHVLLGLSARWLAPVTSHVDAPFDRDLRVGGLAVGVGLALRLGGAVPRDGLPDRT